MPSLRQIHFCWLDLVAVVVKSIVRVVTSCAEQSLVCHSFSALTHKVCYEHSSSGIH